MQVDPRSRWELELAFASDLHTVDLCRTGEPYADVVEIHVVPERRTRRQRHTPKVDIARERSRTLERIDLGAGGTRKPEVDLLALDAPGVALHAWSVS
jgi:hypothetical protein